MFKGAGFTVFADKHVGDSDLNLVVDRQALLRRFRRDLQLFERVGVVARVEPFFCDKAVRKHVEDTIVEVVATEEGVATRCQHFKDVLADLEDRNVERTATEVINSDLLVEAFTEAIGEGGSRGFVEDAQYFKARDLSCVLGGLSLVVVEVCGHGNDRFGDFFIESRFRDLLHLAKHHCRNLGQRKVFLAHADAHAVVCALSNLVGADRLGFACFFRKVVPAYESLGRRNGVRRIMDDVGPRGVAYGDGSALVKRHDTRGRVFAERIRKHFKLSVFHRRHARITRS